MTTFHQYATVAQSIRVAGGTYVGPHALWMEVTVSTSEPLASALRQMAMTARAALATQYRDASRLPMKTRRRAPNFGTGVQLPRTERVPNWHQVALNAMRLCQEAEATEQLHRLLDETPATADLINELDPGKLGYSEFVTGFFEQVLSADQSTAITDTSVAGAIAAVCEALESETIPKRVVAPLTGFHCPVDEIPLEPEFRIAALSDADWDALASHHRGSGFVWLQSRHALIASVRIPRTDEPFGYEDLETAHQAIWNRFRSCLSALRLFRPGMIGFSWIHWLPAGFDPTRGVSSYSAPIVVGPGPFYVLPEAQIDRFKTFWRNLNTSEPATPRLATAIRWLEGAYDRSSIEDRLINYAIAGEALLGLEQTEMAYRFALRAAALLGGSAPDRQEHFDLATRLYKARSRLVHGEPVEKVTQRFGNTDKLWEFLLASENLLRRLIDRYRMLAGQVGEREIIPTLDRRIVESQEV